MTTEPNGLTYTPPEPKRDTHWSLADEKRFIDGLGEWSVRNRIRASTMDRVQFKKLRKELLCKYLVGLAQRTDFDFYKPAIKYAYEAFRKVGGSLSDIMVTS